MFAPVNLCTPIIIPLLNNNDSLYCYPPTTRENWGSQCGLTLVTKPSQLSWPTGGMSIKFTKLTIWLPIYSFLSLRLVEPTNQPLKSPSILHNHHNWGQSPWSPTTTEALKSETTQQNPIIRVLST